jgi:hypothetical protein
VQSSAGSSPVASTIFSRGLYQPPRLLELNSKSLTPTPAGAPAPPTWSAAVLGGLVPHSGTSGPFARLGRQQDLQNSLASFRFAEHRDGLLGRDALLIDLRAAGAYNAGMREFFLVGAAASTLLWGCAGKAEKSETEGDAQGTGGYVALESPGTTQLEFKVDPARSYCRTTDGCGTSSLITISNSAGQVVGPAGGLGCGRVACDTCTESPCPGIACFLQAQVVTGENLTWSGTIAGQWTCGQDALTCQYSSAVPAGTYTAKMCATPGSLTDADEPECIPEGEPECVEVEFEFPSGELVVGQLGPGAL